MTDLRHLKEIILVKAAPPLVRCKMKSFCFSRFFFKMKYTINDLSEAEWSGYCPGGEETFVTGKLWRKFRVKS